jgi:hypothetical protein
MVLAGIKKNSNRTMMPPQHAVAVIIAFVGFEDLRSSRQQTKMQITADNNICSYTLYLLLFTHLI